MRSATSTRRRTGLGTILAVFGAVAVLRAMPVFVEIARVPVARLAENIERQLAARPDDVTLRLNLARLHAMAYAMKATVFDAVGKEAKLAAWFGHVPPYMPGPVLPAPSREHEERAKQELAKAVRVYADTCETTFKRPMRRAMCSYFVHIASTPADEQYGKEALVSYFQDALISAFPSSSGEKVPPTYKYFVDIVNILRDMRPEKLTDKSILCGSPQHIVDSLKKVEAAGIAEVILYFNLGLKPHARVKDEMARFMAEVAPAF